MSTDVSTPTRIVKPQTQGPELRIATVGGEPWRLADQQPERFTLIVFYRGLHCPVCRKQLKELERRLDEFASRGVEVIAISGDTRESAERGRDEWKLEHLPIGFGLSVEAMRDWGLFVSHRIKDDEPELFSEPAVFLISSDGTVFYEAINSMPFGRPSFDDLLGAIDFIGEHDYPARGEA